MTIFEPRFPIIQQCVWDGKSGGAKSNGRVGSAARGAERLDNLYLWRDQHGRNHAVDLGRNWFNEKVSSSSRGTTLDFIYRILDGDEVAPPINSQRSGPASTYLI